MPMHAMPVQPPSAPQVQIGASPTWQIADDGTPEKQFTRITVRKVGRGDIVVADLDSRFLRVFDSTGRVSATLARLGNGPVEISGGFAMQTRGDTIFVIGQPPSTLPTVQSYLASGKFLGRTEPLRCGTSVSIMNRLSAGAFVVQRGDGGKTLRTAPELGRLLPDTGQIGVARAVGNDSLRIAWLPAFVRGWSYAHAWPRGPIASTVSRYPFAAATFVIPTARGVWLVDAGTGTIAAYDDAGRLVFSRTVAVARAAYDPKILAPLQQRLLAQAVRPIDSARAKAVSDPAILPKFMPLFDGGVVADNGEVWLRRFDPDERAASAYVVLDAAGNRIAEWTAPKSFELQQVGPTFVLGTLRDADGLVRIAEYRITGASGR
jgi:hypothetical protein